MVWYVHGEKKTSDVFLKLTLLIGVLNIILGKSV